MSLDDSTEKLGSPYRWPTTLDDAGDHTAKAVAASIARAGWWRNFQSRALRLLATFAQVRFAMIHNFARLFWVAEPWWIVLIACALGVTAAFIWRLRTGIPRVADLQLKQEKKRRALADRISTYGRKVRRRYPTGDVVVSVVDLALKVRRRPEAVASALDLLPGEEKVRKTTLGGYWKLNA